MGCVGEAAGRALARDRPKQGECGWARRATARGQEIRKEGKGWNAGTKGEKKGGPSGQMREGRFSSSSSFQNPFLFLNSISFLNSKQFQM